MGAHLERPIGAARPGRRNALRDVLRGRALPRRAGAPGAAGRAVTGPYLEADEAMRRATEAIAEATALLAALPAPDGPGLAGMLERVTRRTQNAGAQLELDRRIVADVRERAGIV